VHRGRRYGSRFSLVLLDLDHFKRINDGQGHDAGDHVLRELGLRLREMVRGDDLPARFGGEEFTFLLAETDRAGAATFAERVRARVEQHRFEFRDHPIPVTVSVGFGTFPEDGDSGEALLHAVDAALYRAKSGGRNRCEGA
jgi:diguanylate cyclase (GGDEF)-like protein